ncbi:MAG TPA: hypothetical protein VL971_08690 [Rhizomicrobium sp.]|nr:hypothetical protein [Rhizomicrobium sp.]
MRRRLFVAYQDVADGVFPEKRVVKAETVARYAENMGYAVRFQQFYEGIAAF